MNDEGLLPRFRTSRRRFMHRAMSAAAATLLPSAARAAARVVIVGGGFAGASCARALRKADPPLDVTLIEQQRVYTAPPLANGVLGGLRALSAQQFSYDALAAAGVRVVHQAAVAVDPHARSVTLRSGDKLPYERLVLAPGIGFRFGALAGHSEALAAQVPHAWTAEGAQLALLRRQLEAMDDGGQVVITVPATPSRCPPGPYERASMIACFLKGRKPRSKLVILDAKDAFTMQELFQDAWKELYPGIIEWVSPSKGGDLASIDVPGRTIATDFDTYKFAVANVIPPQIAAPIAVAAGAADRTGWCPVDPVSFESTLQRNVHVIGDAAIAGAMPKSAFAASVQGALCAAAIVRLAAGATPAAAKLLSNCYSMVGRDYAISIVGVYQVAGGEFQEVEGAGGVSPLNAPRAFRAKEAAFAEAWFGTTTRQIFG